MKGEIYGGPKYLRMNIGCPQSKLKEGLRRFKNSNGCIIFKIGGIYYALFIN